MSGLGINTDRGGLSAGDDAAKIIKMPGGRIVIFHSVAPSNSFPHTWSPFAGAWAQVGVFCCTLGCTTLGNLLALLFLARNYVASLGRCFLIVFIEGPSHNLGKARQRSGHKGRGRARSQIWKRMLSGGSGPLEPIRCGRAECTTMLSREQTETD